MLPVLCGLYVTVCVCVYVCMYVCMYVYVYECVYGSPPSPLPPLQLMNRLNNFYGICGEEKTN
jgi:hypothetical protein